MAGGGHRSFGVGKWGGEGQAREARWNALNRTEGGGCPWYRGWGLGGYSVSRNTRIYEFWRDKTRALS